MPRLHTLLLVPILAAPPIAAQCDFTWLPGSPSSGPNDRVWALLKLPSGDLIAGGTFDFADAVRASNIARWDGTTWQALAAGSNDQVLSLARLPNGDVVAGGLFTMMGTVPCNHIARWNGTTWSPIGTGLDGQVEALLVQPNGDLLAAGSFANAGATPVGCVARWNGTTWTAFGTGLPNGSCHALEQMPNGDIYAGGQFLGSWFAGLVRLTNGVWAPEPAIDAFTLPAVNHLARLANGSLAIAGTFAVNGVPQTLTIWNGTTSSPVTPPVQGTVNSLLGAANGDLLMGGPTPVGQSGLWRWNGTTWTPSATGGPIAVLALAQDALGNVIAGGVGSGPPLQRTNPVSVFNGTQWQNLGAPTPPIPQALLTMPNGDVVVGGTFTSFAGIAASRLARWNGSAWAPLGLGVDGTVRALATAPNGDLIVGGAFLNAGGAPASRIARWNGSAWSTLGAGIPAEVTNLAVTPGGVIYATTTAPGLREFRNGQWTLINIPGGLVSPSSLAVLANGDLALGGIFQVPGFGLVALYTYDGTTFTPIPSALSYGGRVVVGRDGTLYLAGSAGVRSWNGTTWTTLFSVSAQTLAELPNGDLLIGGTQASAMGTSTASALYRGNASGLVSIGAIQGGAVNRLAVSGRGDIFAAGTFTTANDAVSFYFTQAAPTCPAATQIVGSGCAGGAGPVTLAAQSLPWVGGTFRAEASGMTTNSLALQLLGLQAASGPLPGGAPGCSLFVNPIVVDALLPAGGVAQAAFVVPNQPSLAGLTFRLQVVGVELGTAGIVRLTSTNALEATIGVL